MVNGGLMDGEWMVNGWLVGGGLEHEFYVPFHIWDGMSSFPLTNLYFSEG